MQKFNNIDDKYKYNYNYNDNIENNSNLNFNNKIKVHEIIFRISQKLKQTNQFKSSLSFLLITLNSNKWTPYQQTLLRLYASDLIIKINSNSNSNSNSNTINQHDQQYSNSFMIELLERAFNQFFHLFNI